MTKGCVILDLQRMKNIMKVNEEYGYAIVEPGMSFFDLFNEIQRRGFNVNQAMARKGIDDTICIL